MLKEEHRNLNNDKQSVKQGKGIIYGLWNIIRSQKEDHFTVVKETEVKETKEIYLKTIQTIHGLTFCTSDSRVFI